MEVKIFFKATGTAFRSMGTRFSEVVATFLAEIMAGKNDFPKALIAKVAVIGRE
jgi:hypothetical protein